MVPGPMIIPKLVFIYDAKNMILRSLSSGRVILTVLMSRVRNTPVVCHHVTEQLWLVSQYTLNFCAINWLAELFSSETV